MRRGSDGGFTIVEIMVAVMLLVMALTAAAPQVVGSIRATGKSKLIAQAKGILQGQLDAMRTLPFRVAPSAGDHLDLLDTYYRNLASPATVPVCQTAAGLAVPAATWAGYVPAASSARCAYEPAGAFYRAVIAPGTNSLPAGFAVTLATQFVSAATPSTVLTPASTYNTQVTGLDRAPSQQIGVTATVLYRDRGRWLPRTVYTQIASQTPATPQINLAATATVLELGSAAPPSGSVPGDPLTLTGGQLGLTGSLFNASEAKAGLTAIGAASSAAGRRTGASLAVNAPYSNPADTDAAAGGLLADCSGVCWAASRVSPVVVSAEDALPRVGVDASGVVRPLRALLPDKASRDGFQFRTGSTTLPGLKENLISLDSTPPAGTLLTSLASGAFGCSFGAADPVSYLAASGYLNSTTALASTNPLSVDACAGGRTDVIRVLPTDLAPGGLVRITARSSARCTVSGAAHTPTAKPEYRAEIEYWSWNSVTSSGAYVLAGVISSANGVDPATTSDPLASVDFATPVSNTEKLGDYIESWAGLTAAGVQTSETAGVASLTVPALVTLQTKPLRGSGDPGSAVSLGVGAASCYAEDHR